MATPGDKAILDWIINPFLPVGESDSAHLSDEVGEITEEILEAKRLEKEAVLMAEEGRTQEAVELLGKAIEIAPRLASLYNNRAQALRLRGDTASALEDLNLALSISGGSGRSASQAFCQRGLIRRKNGQEDGAMEDFGRAAKLGNPFAKMVLVQSNPYAALCNDMLSQMTKKLIEGG